jgi:hypothetical protein
VFDTAFYPDLPSPHFRKLRSVLSAFDSNDWVFWLDDDAYFTKMSKRLEDFLQDIPDEIFLVIGSSPVNPQGGWTFISSGQFFIRNNACSKAFLHDILTTSVETARQWWNPSLYGMFTNGDQDSMVYILVTQNLLERTKIVPFQAFNARPYHYGERIDDYFLVHFPGVPDKQEAVSAFGARFRLDDTLIPGREARQPNEPPLDAVIDAAGTMTRSGFFEFGRFLRRLSRMFCRRQDGPT